MGKYSNAGHPDYVTEGMHESDCDAPTGADIDLYHEEQMTPDEWLADPHIQQAQAELDAAAHKITCGNCGEQYPADLMIRTLDLDYLCESCAIGFIPF